MAGVTSRLGLAALALGLAACALPGLSGSGGDDDGGDAGLPPEPPPLPTPAVYVRGSLVPLFQLTPSAEQGRFDILGTRLTDADFTTSATGFVTLAQKLDEVASQISEERGAAVSILTTVDRIRAQRMPFRGNPSDVELVGERAFVALGGDLGTPGNEVAVADLGGGPVARVRVGIRPVKLAAAGGLVFVCNQYSNYVSIIDPLAADLLRRADGPVEIATDYYCTDVVVAAANPGIDDDLYDLYLANSWRASVLRHRVSVARDAAGRPTDVTIADPVGAELISTPAAEIRGVGSNPSRLSLTDDQRAVLVASIRGGEVAKIDRATDAATARLAINGPAGDILQVGSRVFVPTTTIDRGLLDRAAPAPVQVEALPVVVTGLDGQPAEAHPGAMFDGTRAYNFEDLRNGVVQLDAALAEASLRYFTDDVSAEANFSAAQKILTGALPTAVVKNAAGTRVYLALAGSDQIQELAVVGGALGLAPVDGGTFATGTRPYALAIDEAAGRLAVATWGGEVLEIFDLASRERLERVDLGYAALASAPYPATNIERGQFFYFNAGWSNNGRKACATCHFDELQVDGVGFSNGATAPTAYHQVRPNWNLMTTDSYFWNGSFRNGSYASLAFSAQSRTNCELVLFGLIEGPASDPATRVGDPANRVTDGRDAECRPEPLVDGLPGNFDAIAAIIAAQKVVADQVIRAETGLSRVEVSRLVDFYGVAQLRLPPNPLTRLRAAGELGSDWTAMLDRGEALFTSAGCASCHTPDDARHPFADGKQHGSGADWASRFINRYLADDRVTITSVMTDAITDSVADREINIHLPTDYFEPFCFSTDDCLVFEDPLAAVGDLAEESRRLELIDRINLRDPERGFVPGNVVGQPAINTPSLRGAWWQPNILHHGLARSVAEAILGPGHAALQGGERGFAIDALGTVDVHGATSGLSADEVAALVLYVESIE